MKYLITYATKHGFAEKCAKLLSEKLNGHVDLCNLKKDTAPSIEKYDAVILGGSIYMGQIQKEVKEFCTKNISELNKKRIGLYICCMRKEDEAITQINNTFPKELLEVACAKDAFGGEFIMSKMNFLEKFIVKKVAKITEDTTFFSEQNFNRFLEAINNQ